MAPLWAQLTSAAAPFSSASPLKMKNWAFRRRRRTFFSFCSALLRFASPRFVFASLLRLRPRRRRRENLPGVGGVSSSFPPLGKIFSHPRRRRLLPSSEPMDSLISHVRIRLPPIIPGSCFFLPSLFDFSLTLSLLTLRSTRFPSAELVIS